MEIFLNESKSLSTWSNEPPAMLDGLPESKGNCAGGTRQAPEISPGFEDVPNWCVESEEGLCKTLGVVREEEEEEEVSMKVKSKEGSFQTMVMT